MLQSNDANPTLYQTPQTMPPQYFVEALMEYSGKQKRSSRDHGAFNLASSNQSNNSRSSLGLWKNMSATNLGGLGGGGSETALFHALSSSAERAGLASSILQQRPHTPSQQQSFQQHLTALLGGKSEKRILEEREQVLKKLRVLIRNGSIRWTGEFIKAGGPLALIQFCSHTQKSEET